MKNLQKMIFDYPELLYCEGNPLNFVLLNELYDVIRKSFHLLNDEEKFILEEVIIKKKSIINTALILDVSEKEIEKRLERTTELLYHFFKYKYYGENKC